MPPHRIFVPHIHEDDAYVSDLRDMLNAHGREADVSAIDSTSPNKPRTRTTSCRRTSGRGWSGVRR